MFFLNVILTFQLHVAYRNTFIWIGVIKIEVNLRTLAFSYFYSLSVHISLTIAAVHRPSRTTRIEFFLTHSEVQSTGLHHPWPPLIENWFMF